MKIAITGSSGFIGTRFINQYSDKFEEVIALNLSGVNKVEGNIKHIHSHLSNLSDLISYTTECDIFLHLAFDHKYKENIIGIKNILEACVVNHIKKLIYISTINVYDPDYKGFINEFSPYSKILDPYTKEKQKIERIIASDKNSDLKVLIIQPTIIYGLTGNWTKYAFAAAKSNRLILPQTGKGLCNAVYIDDVTQALFKSCTHGFQSMQNNVEKIIISGESSLQWTDFLDGHRKILENLHFPYNKSQNVINNSNEFHSNIIYNLIFKIWFKTPFGFMFDFLTSTLKQLRSKNNLTIIDNKSYNSFLNFEPNNNTVEPIAATKKTFNARFKVKIAKAEQMLCYSPSFNFKQGLSDIENILKTNS